MKKTTLTFLANSLRSIVLLGVLLFSNSYESQAQCVPACNGLTNIGIDGNTCEAVITVGMVADTSGCPGGAWKVIVKDPQGNVIPNATVTAPYLNMNLIVEVWDTLSNNYCWGNLIVEDKVAPTITCTNPTTPVYCYNEDFTVTPTATDNCDMDPDIILLSEVIDVNTCDNTYSDEVIRHVTRTYKAVDNQGLESSVCTLEYDVLRIPNLNIINFPDPLIAINGTALSCDANYPLDPNGHPSPLGMDGTGVPMIIAEADNIPGLDTILLFPDQYAACNLLASYDDTVLPPIGCTQKIMRTWTVIEWSCSNPQRSIEFVQMIEITDNEGPTFTCPSDMTVSTNSGACAATTLLPAVNATDNCSAAVTVDISYPGGFIDNSNGGLAQIPMGVNQVTYTVYDGCLNSSTCTFTVTVEDQTPPVAVCIENSVVALTTDGCAFVPATVFNNGSYDECSGVTIAVKRMDNGLPCETGTNCELEDDQIFDSQVRFCCSDVGNSDLMVILQVTDAAGNTNQCMVNVQVQDKLAPTIVCPSDMTVECDFGYDINNPDAFFGAPVITGSCGTPIPTNTFDDSQISQCNVGILVRTISVSGGGQTVSCQQNITFVNNDPFNGNVDIIWPNDVFLDGCDDPTNPAYDPDNTGKPVLTQGACDLVGVSYDDQIFPFNNQNINACFKIVRKWTVIDWCGAYQGPYGTVYPTYTHTQIIKVSDPVAPEDITITGPSQVCTYDADCANGPVSITASSSDVCTQVLDWSYEVNVDNNCDGSFDGLYVYNGVPQSFSGQGNTINFNHTYAIGCYQVVFSFYDKCGNVTTKAFEFNIESCKAPTPYLLNGLAIDIMPDGNGGGMIATWVSDFDNGSFHPCGYDVYLSFEPVVFSPSGLLKKQPGDTVLTVPGIQFTCEDIGDQDVTIYAAVVTPSDSIVQTFVVTSISIQDNQGVCSGTNTGNKVDVSGTIHTVDNEMLEDAVVNLIGVETESEMTNAQGQYAFPDMPMGGNYTILPSKEDDYTNGVSTLDLVMIQRHILEIEPFDDVHDYVAADINKDAEITAADLVQLRKLILGVYAKLPNNGSWRFIDVNYQFDEDDPLAGNIDEDYNIQNLSEDMSIDFEAVKVGDINGNAVANIQSSNDSEARSGQSIEWVVAEKSFSTGQTVTLPVAVDQSMNMVGFQTSFKFDPRMVSFAGITNEAINLYDFNVNVTNNMVTISWDNPTGININEGEALFDLEFVAVSSGEVSKAISIDKRGLNAEMYDGDMNVFDMDLSIQSRGAEDIDFALYQNTPNPFDHTSSIAFDLPYATMGSLTIYDLTGRKVYDMSDSFAKGHNVITLDASTIQGSGILYYTLNAGEYTATQKMLLID